MVCANETDSDVPEQTLLPGDSNTVALECVAELNSRMKYVEKSSYDQGTRNESMRKELDEIFARLVVVETEIKKVAKQGYNKATECQKTGRSLRRGNND
ncbi:hypothetical protein LT330_010688 [Penicillium expansum]|nr:hypothetical protein LT330_010688 [Penicillium expansum]